MGKNVEQDLGQNRDTCGVTLASELISTMNCIYEIYLYLMNSVTVCYRNLAGLNIFKNLDS